jgi:hypothetical protein
MPSAIDQGGESIKRCLRLQFAVRSCLLRHPSTPERSLKNPICCQTRRSDSIKLRSSMSKHIGTRSVCGRVDIDLKVFPLLAVARRKKLLEADVPRHGESHTQRFSLVYLTLKPLVRATLYRLRFHAENTKAER